MDQIATSDLLALLLTQRESIDQSFQFWLTVTFAVIAAGFVAGRRLGRRFRLLAALLYVMATAQLVIRLVHDGDTGYRWAQELGERGVDIAVPMPAVYVRMALIAIGTVSALVFLLRPMIRPGPEP